MRNWIIKLLGGLSKREFLDYVERSQDDLRTVKEQNKILTIERDSYKTSSDTMKGQLLQAEKYFEFVAKDRDVFQDLFLTQMGLGSHQRQQDDEFNPDPNAPPINTRPPSVRQLMREMYRDDQRRARETKEAS